MDVKMRDFDAPLGFREIDFSVLPAPACQIQHQRTGLSFRFANRRLEELGDHSAADKPWFPLVIDGARRVLNLYRPEGW